MYAAADSKQLMQREPWHGSWGKEEWGRVGIMMGVLVSTKTINGAATGLAQLHRIVN
jgi:hypothetical protein